VFPAWGSGLLCVATSAIRPGVDTHGGGLGGGGSGGRHSQGAVLVGGGPEGALHITFCPSGGRIRAATSCASAQLQHPHQVEPPSRRPIWPKRAAVSPRSAPKREADPRWPRKSGDRRSFGEGGWSHNRGCECLVRSLRADSRGISLRVPPRHNVRYAG
jgi:hypothetical protein